VAVAVRAAALPLDGATNVDHLTDFLWSRVSGAVYLVRIWKDITEEGFLVLTSDNRARIPDFDRAGLSLAKGATYHWDVYAYGPHATVDDAAAPAASRSTRRCTHRSWTGSEDTPGSAPS
jgi:hypothetical protein